MSGHSRWWIVHPEQIHPVDEIMIQHIQGYILAMEDVLKDIWSMRYNAENAEAEYASGYGQALEDLEFRAKESKASAQRTLDIITKKVDAAE